MACKLCSKKELQSGFCNDHFSAFVENTVVDTVKKYNLILDGQKIMVAVSGGKDSITLLYILNKYFDNVEALCIDEGISNYRANTLGKLKEFCKLHDIKLTVKSYRDEFGHDLDYYMDLIFKNKTLNLKPCTVCGILRRHMINKYSLHFDRSATGHNLDDESQAILMNILKNQIPILARFGPMTGVVNESHFVPRIKPLYFLTEKEILTYSILNKFDLIYDECPYAIHAFRGVVRDQLNLIQKEKNVKLNIVNNYLNMSAKLKSHFKETIEFKYCTLCGAISNNDVCNKCALLKKLGELE